MTARTREHPERVGTTRQALLDVLAVAHDVRDVNDDAQSADFPQRRGRRQDRPDGGVSMVSVGIGQVQQPAERRIDRDGLNSKVPKPLPQAGHLVVPPGSKCRGGVPSSTAVTPASRQASSTVSTGRFTQQPVAAANRHLIRTPSQEVGHDSHGGRVHRRRPGRAPFPVRSSS